MMLDLEDLLGYAYQSLAVWGDDKQRTMAMGEAAEFIDVLAKHARNRATPAQVVDEAADAIIVAAVAVALAGGDSPALMERITRPMKAPAVVCVKCGNVPTSWLNACPKGGEHEDGYPDLVVKQENAARVDSLADACRCGANVAKAPMPHHPECDGNLGTPDGVHRRQRTTAGRRAGDTLRPHAPGFALRRRLQPGAWHLMAVLTWTRVIAWLESEGFWDAADVARKETAARAAGLCIHGGKDRATCPRCINQGEQA